MLNHTAPRYRSIKEDFWKDYRNVGLSRDARLLSLAMKNFADDKGYKLAIPSIIRSEAFPTDDDVTIEMVKKWLEELYDHEFISIVKIEEREFFKLDMSDQKIDKPLKGFTDGIKDYKVNYLTKNESKIFGNNLEKTKNFSEKIEKNSEIFQKNPEKISKNCGKMWKNEFLQEPVDKCLEYNEIEAHKGDSFSKEFSPIRKEKKRIRKEKNKKRVFLNLNKKEEEEFKKNQYEDLNNTMKPEVEQKIISPEIQAHLDEMRKHLPTPTRKQLNEDEVIKQPIIPTHDNIRSIGDLVGGFSA